jgi:hypothetical protein
MSLILFACCHRKYEDELELLKQELELKSRQIEDLRAEMETSIARLNDENECCLQDMKNMFLVEKEAAIEEACRSKAYFSFIFLYLSPHPHTPHPPPFFFLIFISSLLFSFERLLTLCVIIYKVAALQESMQCEYDEKLACAVKREREIAERNLLDEKKKAEETIAKVFF